MSDDRRGVGGPKQGASRLEMIEHPLEMGDAVGMTDHPRVKAQAEHSRMRKFTTFADEELHGILDLIGPLALGVEVFEDHEAILEFEGKREIDQAGDAVGLLVVDPVGAPTDACLLEQAKGGMRLRTGGENQPAIE